MEWINFEEKKPDNMILALVFNQKGWMSDVMAMYHPDQETWVLYDPNYRITLTLQITHYLEIPTPPNR